ncbi:hypothetical protein PG995_004596 [Apiospora arundinis]
MADGAEDAIVVGSQNSISTTIAKRQSTRVTKPTAKIQEASDRPVAEDGEATATDANGKGRDGPAKTYLQKILELVVRAQTEIQDLKQIVPDGRNDRVPLDGDDGHLIAGLTAREANGRAREGHQAGLGVLLLAIGHHDVLPDLA